MSDLPQSRAEERILVQTLIDYPDLFDSVSGLTAAMISDADAKKIFGEMTTMQLAGREWLRSDFPIMTDSVGAPIQPEKHTLFPELMKRIADIDFRRKAWMFGKEVVTGAQKGDVDKLRKTLERDRVPNYSFANGKTPATWADLAAIIPKIKWLWDQWIAIGLLGMIVGAPEVGKSALLAIIARAVIDGLALPDGTRLEGGQRIVWFDTENAEAINLERAEKWGIDRSKVLVPTIDHDALSDINLMDPEGWDAFEIAVRSSDVGLAVVDSLGGAYLRENDPQVKLLVKKLGALSRDAQVPVKVVHHPRKLQLGEHETITLDRVRGHSGIVQFARVIWALEKPDPAMPDRIRCKVIKSNLGRKPKPFGFEISDHGVNWTDAPKEVKQETQLDRAKDLLATLLSDGPLPAVEIFAEGDGAALSKNTIKRAKKVMNIVSVKKEDRWLWSLPGRPEPFIPEA